MFEIANFCEKANLEWSVLKNMTQAPKAQA